MDDEVYFLSNFNSVLADYDDDDDNLRVQIEKPWGYIDFEDMKIYSAQEGK